MAETLLSTGERLFITHGVQDGLRTDGRGIEDYRSLELETEVVTNASGSARVRLANTEVLVGVKAEVEDVQVDTPKEGRVVFFVDCSANATPEFEGRGGEGLATELAAMLDRAYSPAALDLSKLCLVPGSRCWALNVDILVLECGGNLFDTIGLAVKAALFNTRIPVVKVSVGEDGETEMDVSDDPFDNWRLDVNCVPCLVTVNKVGRKHVVDASCEEEACCLASLVLGVTPQGLVSGLAKRGRGSLDPHSALDMTQCAVRVGQTLNSQLQSALEKEEALGDKRRRVGFLGPPRTDT